MSLDDVNSAQNQNETGKTCDVNGSKINNIIHEKETQTSKTILQLVYSDLSNIKADDKANGKHENYINTLKFIINSNEAKEQKSHAKDNLKVGTNKKVSELHPNISKSLEEIFKNLNPNCDKAASFSNMDHAIQVPPLSRFTVKEIRIKAIQKRNKEEINIEEVCEEKELPMEPKLDSVVEDEACLEVQAEEDTDHEEFSSSNNSLTTELAPSEFDRPTDGFHLMLTQIKSTEWDVALKALVEMARQSDTLEKHRVYTHMTEINQRLIAFLRSPRSHVCRTSCQVAGRLFETIKDTRRPEFDEIVELLLIRTADSNKFIRKDANIALDALVLHMPPFHVVRAISQKGPTHKNDLVRTASARLFVCVVGMADGDTIFSHSGNKFTRSRILTHLVTFIKDRNPQTREYGATLYESLSEYQHFDMYLREIVDKSNIDSIRKILIDRKTAI